MWVKMDGWMDMTIIVVIMNECLTDVKILDLGKGRKYEDDTLYLSIYSSSLMAMFNIHAIFDHSDRKNVTVQRRWRTGDGSTKVSHELLTIPHLSIMCSLFAPLHFLMGKMLHIDTHTRNAHELFTWKYFHLRIKAMCVCVCVLRCVIA